VVSVTDPYGRINRIISPFKNSSLERRVDNLAAICEPIVYTSDEPELEPRPSSPLPVVPTEQARLVYSLFFYHSCLLAIRITQIL
jgi:hypothetical protein